MAAKYSAIGQDEGDLGDPPPYRFDAPPANHDQTIPTTGAETQPLVVDEVKQWLSTTVALPQYYENFIKNGCSSLNIIKFIETKEDLSAMGITLRGHQLKLISEIKKISHASPNIVPQHQSVQPITVSHSSNIVPQHQVTQPINTVSHSSNMTATSPPKPQAPNDEQLVKKNKTFRIVAFIIGLLASLFFFIGLCVNNLASITENVLDPGASVTFTCSWTSLIVRVVMHESGDDDDQTGSYADLCANDWSEMSWLSSWTKPDQESVCVTMGMAIAALIPMIFAMLCSIAATILIQPFYDVFDKIDHSLEICEEQKVKPPRALFISAALLGWLSMILWVAGDQMCMTDDEGIDANLGSSMSLCIVGAIFCSIAACLAK